MLVLTRKLQEQISIGQDITITILRVKGNTVRIGIDAPDNVRVLRGELPRHENPLPETPRCDSSTTTVREIRTTPEFAPKGDSVSQHPSPRVRNRSTGLKPIVQRLGQRQHGANVSTFGVAAAAPALVD